MFDVGSIIINKNIVFKEKNELDHVYKTGRPCLVIALNNEYYYYLAVSRSKKANDRTNLPIKFSNKISSPSFLNIFKEPICYKEEIVKIPVKNMLNIYKAFIKYYSTREKCKYYEEVIGYIYNYINKNEKNIH